MPRKPRKPQGRGPGNEIVFSDFNRKRPLWLIVVGAGALLVGVIVVVVVIPLFRSVSPESHEQDAREACHADITAQLDAAAVQFVDETASQFGANNWSVKGTADLGGSDRRAYSCTYAGGELLNAVLQ